MALTKEQKEKVIAGYVEKFSKSQALILADYRGLKMADIQRIRNQLRESGNAFLVVKNTLARIALERIGMPLPADALSGPVAIGLCYKDIAAVSRVFNDMAQETKILSVKGAILGKRLVDAEQAKELANLPSRETLVGQVLGTLQSPIANLVGILAGPLQGLVRVLQARADQLQAA